VKIIVFGAGALGSLIGGLLARTHDVTLVGRDPHVSRVRCDGLRIVGAVDTLTHPDATTGPPPDADAALVTVKTYDTPAAAAALSERGYAAVCSLQNGLGNEGRLAASIDDPVLAGVTTYGAALREPGVVACNGIGHVTLGAPDGGRSATAAQLGGAFAAAGIETRVSTTMPLRLWTKCAVNAGINPVSAVAGVRNGALRHDPERAVARTAARETATVARANGIDLADAAAVAALDRTVEETADNVSSMLADVRASRRTEIGAICDPVIDRAAASGIEVPTLRRLARQVRALSGGPDSRGGRSGDRSPGHST
jgi:2-dehydropantoate 2-reductase